LRYHSPENAVELPNRSGHVCWGGEKGEPAYERGVVTEVSNVGRAMDHWFIMQTECCNYTIQNWYMFSGLTIGGHNDVWIRDNNAFIRVGKKVGKARIFKAEQREGFDPSLVVVLDSQDSYYRTSDTASLPDGWVFVALDASNKYQGLTKAIGLPEGWRLVHGIPGVPLPPVLRGKP
jgi:hypothetical protein